MIMEEKRCRRYPETLHFVSYLWSASRLITLLRDGTLFFFCTPVANDPELSQELLEILAAGFSLVYGLQGGFQCGGMLLLGPGKDRRGYSHRNIQGFSTLGNQVTIAEKRPQRRNTFRKQQIPQGHDATHTGWYRKSEAAPTVETKPTGITAAGAR